MLLERREQSLYASHNQFYVQDDDGGDTSDPSFWTQQTCHNRLATVLGTVGIHTGSYGTVRVVTELHDAAPPLALANWDHVTEAGLKIESGLVCIQGCIDPKPAESFRVMPGAYRVRCCHANLVKAVDSGVGGDWYVVQIWPAPLSPPVVLKHWAEGNATDSETQHFF